MLQVVLAIVVVVIYWIYRKQRDELEPARRNSVKGTCAPVT